MRPMFSYSSTTTLMASEDDALSPGNLPEISSDSNQRSSIKSKERLFPYVSLTRLSDAEKALYQSLFPPLDESIKVDEVLGEAVDDYRGPLYYGRFEQGIIRGVSARMDAFHVDSRV